MCGVSGRTEQHIEPDDIARDNLRKLRLQTEATDYWQPIILWPAEGQEIVSLRGHPFLWHEVFSMAQ